MNTPGFSLMSMMTSLLLSSFLMLGAMNLFGFIEAQDQKLLKKAHQSNALLTAGMLLRQAEWLSLKRPCLDNVSNHIKVLSPLPLPFDVHQQVVDDALANKLRLTRAGSGQWLQGGKGMYRRQVGAFADIIQGVRQGQRVLILDRRLTTASHDWLAISDCHHTLIDQIVSRRLRSNSQKVTLAHPISRSFHHSMVVYALMPTVFYVGKSLIKGSHGRRLLSLYGRDASQRFELVPGIDALTWLGHHSWELHASDMWLSL